MASNNRIKIAYTAIQPLDSDISDCIWVYNDGLLHENFIRDWSTPTTKKLLDFNHQPEADSSFSLPFYQFEALFISPTLINNVPTSQSKAVFSKKSIPFDAFSEIFWCLSRYEEYQWESAHKIPSHIVDNRKNLPRLLVFQNCIHQISMEDIQPNKAYCFKTGGWKFQ